MVRIFRHSGSSKCQIREHSLYMQSRAAMPLGLLKLFSFYIILGNQCNLHYYPHFPNAPHVLTVYLVSEFSPVKVATNIFSDQKLNYELCKID